MKCSLGISHFLEEISKLSYSVVFLYFFALITEKGFLIFSAFRCLYVSFSPLLFASFLFTAICNASPESITNSMDVSLSELQEMVMDREAWRAEIHGVTKSQTQLSDGNELTNLIVHFFVEQKHTL